MQIEAVIERVQASPDIRFGSGAEPGAIRDAESALGVEFPSDYACFLVTLGWLRYEHWAVYGLGADVPRYLDVVYMTLSERTEMLPRLQPHLIAILNDGGGNHHCLDTARMQAGRCPVVFWDHELGPDQVPDDLAPDFTCWLLERIDAD